MIGSRLLCLLVTCSQLILLVNAEVRTRRSIIIDTDIFSDVDDVGALAIANVFHNCGLADLKGVMINTNSKYGAVAASTINTYFRNPSIPIAALRPLNNDTYLDTWTWSSSDFATKLAHHFPHDLPSASTAPEPVESYLDLLSDAPDNSLTIVSLGHLTNLYHLLHHPAARALLIRKVREIVIMGGAYPRGKEFNFSLNVTAPSPSAPCPSTVESEPRQENAAAYVLSHLPPSIPQTFLGLEVGLRVRSGRGLRERAPDTSPVRAAYEWYVGRCGTERESWDPLTVVYAVLGRGGLGTGAGWFEFGNEGGHNSIDARDGSNAWVEDGKEGNQHWLKLREGIDEGEIGETLTDILAWDPERSMCDRDGDGLLRTRFRVQE